MYKICRLEHDLIVKLKLSILTAIKEMQRQEQLTLMPRLFEVFDAIPIVTNNFINNKCENCIFPECNIGKMLTMALSWVTSGQYKECPFEVGLYKQCHSDHGHSF